MPIPRWLLAGILLLNVVSAEASTEAPGKTLRVYGPGGPHHVLEECAELFGRQNDLEVVVRKALPHVLAQKLREEGDIYYGGAEYMAEEFDRINPGVLDLRTMERLHPRRIGIIVRKGNPLNIRGVEDLRQKKLGLIDVKLENMRHLYGAPSNWITNVRRFVYTGRQGLDAWLSSPEIDAWVTYRSWHLLAEEHSDFVEIPGDEALRFIPVALTLRTPYPREAQAFLEFLKSDEARHIFEKHGWD